MKTQENNKLIAEFMGITPNEEGVYHISKHQGYSECNLSYHKDWNWLMPVVEKILNKSDDDELIERFYEIQNVIPNREATYQAVVEFINFYKNK